MDASLLLNGFGLVLCGWLIYCLVFNWRSHSRRREIWKKIPPCPDENWLLGNVVPLAMSDAPWHVLLKWMADSKSGLVRFRIMNKLAVITDDPHAVRKIFQTRFKAYTKDTGFSYGTFLPILGTGLVTSEGQLWQHQRLLMAPALRIDLLETVIPIAMDAVKRLEPKLEKLRGTGETIDMASELRHLTLQVIGEAIMNLPPDECDSILAQTYLPIMEECNKRVIHRWRMYLPTLSWIQQHIRLTRLNRYLKKILYRRWHNQKPGKEPKDLLDKMMEPLKANGHSWNLRLMEQMRYEIKTFLLAGHETSASMLAWALYELLRNPKCLAKVKAEADVLFSATSKTLGREDIEKMEYTLAVLKETLRKYSIVPAVCRELSLETDDLCGFTIPQKTMIVVSIKGVHDKYKDPETFLPERFMSGGEYDSFDDEIRPYMFLPFIQGPRNCLGQYFALLEARYVLAYLIKNFEFEMPRSAEVVRGDVIPEAPRDGLRLFVR